MPKGPQGQRRSAYMIRNAECITKTATGEIKETGYEQPAKSGLARAEACQLNTTTEERSEITRLVAEKCWKQ